MAPKHIVVLGGGLSGLSSSFYLSRRFPHSLITLFEREPRLGGWVRSERVEIEHEAIIATVLLESGPRTLRPSARSVLELISLLGLEDSLITTPKTSPAAKNRFLHIPDGHYPGLTPIPASIKSCLSSPLGPLLLKALLREPFRRGNRPPDVVDESLDAFLTRRFGEPVARTFGSALVHGIYAADARKLSVQAAFPMLWQAEERGQGSVVRGFLTRPGAEEECSAPEELVSRMKDVSVYTFQDGMETITEKLRLDLKARPNVRLLAGVGVDSLGMDDNFQVRTSRGDIFNPTHVVSALPLPQLHSVLHPSLSLPHLTANPTSSVTVLNLVFPSPPSKPIHPPGFGYLIPRPAAGYGSAQASGILGAVFDSCTTSGQDTHAHNRLAKLTVMLGGPHDTMAAHTAIPSVLKHVASHLSANSLPEPVFCRVHHHKECIPTPTVGHLARMKELSAALAGAPWGGRLAVIGAGVGGVSVGDCVRAGREVGKDWE